MNHACIHVDSPVGRLRLTANARALIDIAFDDAGGGQGENQPRTATEHPVLVLAARELEEYFGGERKAFTIPCEPAGTDFERQVWRALAAIPMGETRSYTDIARAVGRERAVRAVGGANHRNPLAIVVPCHRVIGRAGELRGYAGGLDKKAWLLRHEGAIA